MLHVFYSWSISVYSVRNHWGMLYCRSHYDIIASKTAIDMTVQITKVHQEQKNRFLKQKPKWNKILNIFFGSTSMHYSYARSTVRGVGIHSKRQGFPVYNLLYHQERPEAIKTNGSSLCGQGKLRQYFTSWWPRSLCCSQQSINHPILILVSHPWTLHTDVFILSECPSWL